MANNPSTLPDYNGQVNPPDADYPYGSARDDASPGDLTGTPRVAAELKDLQGFQQALLSQAGVIPSGNADTAGNSQYLEAIRVLFTSRVDDLDAVLASDLTGVKSTWASYFDASKIAGSGVGLLSTGVISPGDAGTKDLPNALVYDSEGNQFKYYEPSVNSLAQFGAVLDGVADDAAVVQLWHDRYGASKPIRTSKGQVIGIGEQVEVSDNIDARFNTFKRVALNFPHFFRVTGAATLENNQFDNGGLQLTVNATSGTIICVGSAVQDVNINFNSFFNYAGSIDNSKGDEAILIDQRPGFINATRKPINVIGNSIQGCYRNGIAVTEGLNINILYNEISNCGNSGIDFEPFADGFILRDCVVSYNRIINCGVNQPTYIPYKAFGLAFINAHALSGAFFTNIEVSWNKVYTDETLVDATRGNFLASLGGFVASTIENNKFVVTSRTNTKDVSVDIAALPAGERGQRNEIARNLFVVRFAKIFNAESSRIYKNYFIEVEALSFSNNEETDITENTFSNCLSPVALNGVSGKFSHNEVLTSSSRTFPAVECAQTNIVKKLSVSDNRIIGPFYDGINITASGAASQEIDVERNEFRDIFAWGVRASTSYLLSIDDNKFWDCGGETVGNGGSGNISAAFCQRIKVRRNVSNRCKGQPVRVDRCDPLPQIVGNEMYDEALPPQEASPIYIDRPGNQLAAIKDNIYDVSAGTTPIVTVGPTTPNLGVIQDGNIQPV